MKSWNEIESAWSSEADRLKPRTNGNMRGPRAACRSLSSYDPTADVDVPSSNICVHDGVQKRKWRIGDEAAAREQRQVTAEIPLAR